MAETLNFNVVFVGDNFPVSQVKPDDIDYGEHEPIEQIRLPILLQVQAGPLQVLWTQNRIQVGVSDTEISEDLVELIKTAATSVDEVIGRRATNSMGLNFSFLLDPNELSPEQVCARVWPNDALIGTELSFLRSFDLQRNFSYPDATWGRLRLTTSDQPLGIVIDLNYHYDFSRNPAVSRPRNAIRRFDAAAKHAEALRYSIPDSLADSSEGVKV